MQAAVTKMSVLRDHGSFGGGVTASESLSSKAFPQCPGYPKFAEGADEMSGVHPEAAPAWSTCRAQG